MFDGLFRGSLSQPEERNEAAMADEDRTIPLSNVITFDDERIRGHLDRVVRGTVEETLNALLEAEADRLLRRRSTLVSTFDIVGTSPPVSCFLKQETQ